MTLPMGGDCGFPLAAMAALAVELLPGVPAAGGAQSSPGMVTWMNASAGATVPARTAPGEMSVAYGLLGVAEALVATRRSTSGDVIRTVASFLRTRDRSTGMGRSPQGRGEKNRP